jgi:hypothetical protein
MVLLLINFKEQALQFLESDRGMVVILAVISLITFGIFVPFTGFYWDDWIWKFFSYAYPSDYLLWQPIDRPLAGTLHILLDAVFGDNPLNWQLGNLFFRWASAVGFYYVLRKVFPAQKNVPAILAVFMLVFPVFSEQWISIAFIHHLVPLSVLWLSYLLMFAAMETDQRNKRLGKFGLSILLAGLVMLTTEYYFGIEAFRVVLLCYYLWKRNPQRKLAAVLWESIKLWWAFAGMMLLLAVWRSGLGHSEGATYSVNFSRLFKDGIVSGLGDFLSQIANDLYSATAGVLMKMFSFPKISDLGMLKTSLFYGLLIGSFVLGLFFFRQQIGKTIRQRTAVELIVLGLAGLVIGGLPFWVGGLQYSPSFPDDRLGLMLMMGTCFLIVGLVLLLASFHQIASVILALVAAFSIGSNFLTGAAYTRSWDQQQIFWRQFTARVPALEPGTVVISSQLPAEFMSDLSWMMTLNWLYDSHPTEETLKYGLFYGDSRRMLETITDQTPLVYDMRLVKFESEIDHALVISYNLNSCLHIFNPDNGSSNPNKRHVEGSDLAYSNPDQIILDTDQFERWPEFFDPPESDSWCHFYQLAELALQRGDHAEVARLGDQVFSTGVVAKKVWELAPFIEGYGFLGRWDEALNMTATAVHTDDRVKELLCLVWSRIESGTPDSEAKQTAFIQLESVLTCDK